MLEVVFQVENSITWLARPLNCVYAIFRITLCFLSNTLCFYAFAHNFSHRLSCGLVVLVIRENKWNKWINVYWGRIDRAMHTILKSFGFSFYLFKVLCALTLLDILFQFQSKWRIDGRTSKEYVIFWILNLLESFVVVVCAQYVVLLINGTCWRCSHYSPFLSRQFVL